MTNPEIIQDRRDNSSTVDRRRDVLDLVLVIAKWRKLIALVTLGGMLTSLLVVLFMPKIYTGVAVLMPPQDDPSSATAILGQLIGGGGMTSGANGGIASALGLKTPNDLYVGILQSRTIADRLIERFNLKELYDEGTLVDARRALANKTTITAEKNGLITIAFDDKDPKRASDVANAYVEELDKLTANLAISDASRRRLYYEQHIKKAKDALVRADSDLRRVQERTGLIKPDDQAIAIFQTMSAVRAQISAKEVEMAGMGAFATPRNPDYVRVQEELNGLRKQLSGLEKDNKIGRGNILIPTSKIPGIASEFLETWRQVKYAEVLYETLAKQLELARMDEGKNGTIIQMVDRAVPPDRKSKPKSLLIVLLSTFIASVTGVAIAFVREAWIQMLCEPNSAVRINLLLAHLRRR